MIRNSVYKVGGMFRCRNHVRYEREGQEYRVGVAFGRNIQGGPSSNKPSRKVMIVPGELCVLLSVDRIGGKFFWLHPDHGRIFTRFTEDDFYDGRLFHKTWEEVNQDESVE